MDEQERSFDPTREEQRLNLIFSQIDSDYEGSRNNAATILREWMVKHRRLQHGLRLVLSGTTAERTLRKIHDLESRMEALVQENDLLRAQLGKTDLRSLERRRKATANGHWDDFVDAIKSHLYGGHVAEIPRGAAKLIAGILGYSKTTVHVMLRRMRPVTLQEVEKIRTATPVPPPKPPATKRRAGSGRGAKKSKTDGEIKPQEPTLL